MTGRGSLKGSVQRERHYFDWAATAIPDTAQGRRAVPVLNIPPFGNPSSPYLEGRLARKALEEARSRCAAVLGVPAKNIYFTSGGTESNAMVIHSFLLRKTGGRLLYSAVEHPSVRENCAVLEGLGKPVGLIPVDASGRVSAVTLQHALEKYPDARFAAIMAVNNETGAVMDTAAIAAQLRSRGDTGRGSAAPIHLHCDMVQAAGKIPVDLTGCDSAALSAHKIGGPRGIGLLYLRRPLKTVYSGGEQEGGIRPGTENTAGALALADCLERRLSTAILTEAYGAAANRMAKLIRGLRSIERCSLIPEDRLEEDGRFSPWILQTAFAGVPGEVMVRTLDEAGFAISTGSACSSAKTERPVLAAMGVDDKRSLEGIRISQGWSTTDEEIDLLIEAIRGVLQFL
ncbi:aminotransferase V [Spirochaetia bacterium]|nr:aminotransferase V [Spirochaetia bacterium]